MPSLHIDLDQLRLQYFVRGLLGETIDECWEWAGCKTPDGYGTMTIDYATVGAHRFAYETFIGPIPDGLEIDHLCVNPSCVNPRHLEPVTPSENMRRQWLRRGKKEGECFHGHAMTVENTIVRKNGSRICATCRKASNRKYAKARYRRLKQEREAAQ